MRSFERSWTRTRATAIALAIGFAACAAVSIPTPATAQGTPATMTTASGLQDHRHQGRHRRAAQDRPDLRDALHRLALGERRQGREVRQLARPRPAVRVPDRQPAASSRAGTRAWPTMKVGGKRTLLIPPRARLRRARRRRRHPAERDAAVRGRAAGREGVDRRARRGILDRTPPLDGEGGAKRRVG